MAVDMSTLKAYTSEELLAQIRTLQDELDRRRLSPSPHLPSNQAGDPHQLSLSESEQRYYSLYENNPSMYFTLSPDGGVLSVNRFGAEQLGYTQEELLGQSVLCVFDPADHATVLQQLTICTHSPSQTFSWEIGKVRKNGSRLWVKERARCVLDHRGRTTVLIVCEDITDRKQAEAVLQESERRLRLIVDSEPECVTIVRPDGLLQTINPAGLAMIEAASEAEVCGRPVLPLIHPDDRHAFERFHSAACAGQITTLCFRICGIHGKERLVESHAVPLRDNHGTVTGVLSVTRDITEQRRTEQALRNSEARLNFLLSHSPVVIYTAATTGDYDATFVSANVVDQLGYEPQDFTSTPRFWADRVHPDDRDRIFGSLSTLFAQGAHALEYRFLNKQGAYRWMRDELILIRDHVGNPVEILGSWFDITERKLAEDALRASEDRLRRFVAEAPVGLVILDNQRRVFTANKAFCKLTGYAEQDLIGHTYDLYTHPDDLSKNLALTDGFYQGIHSGYSLEKRYVRKSGDTIWVSIKATGIELPNQPGPLLLASVQDITARRQASQERERFSQDLHDNILQSLYAVGMQLEASKLTFGKAPRKSKSYTAQAIDQLNRLVIDVRQFIALLKQQTSPAMDFGQALRQLVASFSPAGETGTELDIKDTVIAKITAEQGEQLLNIAREALSNSIRHAQASHRWVRLSHTGRAVRMQICDDGIGFDPKRTRKLGHGLTNMAARAKRIRARFSLESRPRKGTMITIDLPTENRREHA